MAIDMGPGTSAGGQELHDFFKEVFRLQHLLAQVMDAVHEQSGLRTPQKRLGEILEKDGAMTVPQAAAHLGVSRQFVQTLGNQMAAAGLLAFSENPRHKRSKLISLTDQGRGVLDQAQRSEAAIIERGAPPVAGKAVRDATSLAAVLSEWLQEAVEKFGCSCAGVGTGGKKPG